MFNEKDAQFGSVGGVYTRYGNNLILLSLKTLSDASFQTEGVEVPPHTNLYVEVLAAPHMRGM